MIDPYQVLGISRNASDEEIKKVYRTLSRKYHPDSNINNPNKDLAEAKFKEIQQAYQQIMQERTRGYSDSEGGQGSYEEPFGGFWGFGTWSQQRRSQQTAGDSDPEMSRLNAAMNYINNGYYQEALRTLSDISNHSARWYYLSALANLGIRNNMTALEHAKMASQLEPSNIEYERLVYQLESGGTWYQTQRSPYGMNPLEGNNLCLRLCMLQLACNVCCGGRIFFC